MMLPDDIAGEEKIRSYVRKQQLLEVDVTSAQIAGWLRDYHLASAADVAGLADIGPLNHYANERRWWFTGTALGGWHLLEERPMRGSAPVVAMAYLLLPGNTIDVEVQLNLMGGKLPYVEYAVPHGQGGRSGFGIFEDDVDERIARDIHHFTLDLMQELIPG